MRVGAYVCLLGDLSLAQINDWYVISVRSASEDSAASWIRSTMRGLVYYPQARRVDVKSASAKRSVHLDVLERAAFYGYVFASFDYIPNWEVLRQCSSIHGLLKVFSHDEIHNGIPYPVYVPLQIPAATIATLHSREKAGEFDAQAANPLVKKLIGVFVRIPYGTFMGYQGKIKKIVDGNVKVTLPVIKGVRPTELCFRIDELFTSSEW